MIRLISAFLVAKGGATAVEYALMCMCLVLIIVAALTTIGTKLSNDFSTVSNAFS